MSNRGKLLTYLGNAAFVLAGLAALWLAGQDYLEYLGELGLLNGFRLISRFGFGLVLLELFLAAILFGIAWIIFKPAWTDRLTRLVLKLRARSYRHPGQVRSWARSLTLLLWIAFRWLAASLVILLPLLFLQHVQWSAALGFWARLILTVGIGLTVSLLTTRSDEHLIRTSNLAAVWIVTASLFVFLQAFVGVSSYPFSLGWSEGNRIWDYSVLFGHRFYNYPAEQPIFAYLDLGRQSLWGLPFLFARIPIWAMRLWNGLVSTVPYAVLGWLAFQSIRKNRWVWFLCGLWTFLFLNQGPIYTPLVLSAWLVAIAWRRPLWIAIPLVMIAGFYAQITRFTWMFAPAVWAAMLFFSDLSAGRVDDPSDQEKTKKYPWGSSIAIFLAGAVGGYLLPKWIDINKFAASAPLAGAESGAAGIDVGSVSGLGAFISRQPLLWERLLPNPTYGPGILLALLIASVPLALYLVYLVRTRQWPLDFLRGAAVLLPLLAFLGVGLVASVKIGGGGDLHNMDMFLITLVFASALAWRAGGYRAIFRLDFQPVWIQAIWLVMAFIFAFQALLDSAPVRIPPSAKTREALAYIQDQVASAADQGEVLFLDQRQLLTFNQVPAIPLVVEYEKKYLMDQALSSDAAYFASFHQDLARQRFALIISEPLKVVFQGEEHHFGDENDAWVKWVAQPILCYYEPIKTFKEVKVQILAPRLVPEDCSK